jgi:hypothetical protein
MDYKLDKIKYNWTVVGNKLADDQILFNKLVLPFYHLS